MQTRNSSGNLFRSNVVADVPVPLASAEVCQWQCRNFKEEGCVAFIYEEVTKECTLYNSVGHIKYDEDKDKKVMGLAEACLPCHRSGWDYDTDSKIHILFNP